MSQKFPFVFKASKSLPAAPRDMDATWFFPNGVEVSGSRAPPLRFKAATWHHSN
jgi:hypothetical protein